MKYYEIAAKFREALVSRGWAVQHDYFGDFLVRRGDDKVAVRVLDGKVEVRKFVKTPKGGFKLVHKSLVTPAPGADFTWGDGFVAESLTKLALS